jgi:hypothetical protein
MPGCRSDIHQKNLLVARAFCDRGDGVRARHPGRPAPSAAGSRHGECTQLGRRSKDAIEARHVGIVHEVEIALHRLPQSVDAGVIRFRRSVMARSFVVVA